MSLVNYEEIKNITLKTNGLINEEVIIYAKDFLINRLKDFVSPEYFEEVKNKIANINISLLSSEEFKNRYYQNNGQGLLPSGFYYNGKITFSLDKEFVGKSFHHLIHEMLHAISDNHQGKIGLYYTNFEEKYYYGYGFNEACTEYLTSLICDEPFTGYALDLYYVFELFKDLTRLSIPQILEIYLSKNYWLTTDLVNKFSSDKDALSQLVVEYDNRLPQLKKLEFNPTITLNILLETIEEKIKTNSRLDYKNITKLIKEYYDYLSDIWDISNSINTKLEEVLNLLELENTKEKTNI